MPSYTIRATDKETGEVRLMKVQAGTPMTEVIKQYAALSGIDEAECRFLVGGKPLKTDKPLAEQVAGDLDRVGGRLETFAQEFSTLLARQLDEGGR